MEFHERFLSDVLEVLDVFLNILFRKNSYPMNLLCIVIMR